MKELIRQDRGVTTDDIAECIGVSRGKAKKIVGELGFAMVCARLIPRQLTDAHKQSRFEACSELLERHSNMDLFLHF